MARFKQEPVTQGAMKYAFDNCKQWRCYSCHKTFDEEHFYCPNCECGTVEPVLELPKSKFICPTCGQDTENGK